MTLGKSGGRIRVLLVDDSTLARKYVAEGLQRAGDIEVVGEAASAQEALTKAEGLRPDLVLLDIVLPDLPGDRVATELTNIWGIPVIAMTSLEDPALHERVRKAGARAVWLKRGLGPEEMKALVNLVRQYGRVEGHTARREGQPLATPPFPLVVFASSTGGPPVLRAVLQELSPPFPAAIVVVQHIVDYVITQTRRWLQEVTRLPVVVAQADLKVEPGVVYLLPGEELLTIARDAFRRVEPAPPVPYRPSADLFLQSAVGVFGRWLVAVILSGMGKDGMLGAAQVAKAGGVVIVQDPEEAPVPSMPRAVLHSGIRCTTLRTPEIPAYLVNVVTQLQRSLEQGTTMPPSGLPYD